MNTIEKKYKAVLAFDFDKTIAHTTYPTIHHLHENAKEVINKLHDEHDCYIIIWTCRHDIYEQDAIDFLRKEGVIFNQINNHNPLLIEKFQNDTRKISADIYIDDKDIHALLSVNFPNFEEIYHNIVHIITHPTFKSLLTH